MRVTGTAAFMAPERIDGREYSFPSDVWALGLVILTLAQGHLPIDTGGGFWSILHQVRDLPPPTLDESRDWSAGFRDFINSCLRRDPNKRASCTELLTHRFLERRCLDEPEPAAAPHAREEVQAVLRSLADHIRTVASAEGGGQKDASALLHSLLYARGGGSLDDSCVNPRLAELCGQLSITETECLLYFKEFMIAFNAEFSIV
jgi:serine/threonine protein kinase